MKKIVLVFVLVLTMTLIAGCSSTGDGGNTTGKNTEMTDLAKYNGDWKLRVTGDDEELYLISSLEEYLGSAGIHIQEIDGDEVAGTIFSIQGAPSHRRAEVRFSGQIENGKLRTSYEDEAWGYTGDIELVFKDEMITAAITRDKVEPAPMWGVPEGEFTFIRPIETERVKLTGREKESLEEFLRPTIKDSIEPFAEGSLTDDSMIRFIGCSLAVGFIDHSEFGEKVTEGVEIQFDESVMNDLARKYFSVEVKEHKTVDIVSYGEGKYSVPALGGVSEYPRIQLFMKDNNNKDIYYAVVDYIFEGPEGGPEQEYQYLIKLRKTDGYIIKSIKEIKDPINF